MADYPFSSGFPEASNVIETPGNPLKTALLVSACFFVAGVSYILLSSRIAALTAATIPELAFIEQIKGFLFIVCMTLLLFGVIYGLLLRIHRQHQRIMNFGNRLIAAERQATAAVFADSVAHDLGNMLMSLEYYTGELAETTGEEKAAALGQLTESHARLKSLVQRLTAAGGRPPGEAQKQYFNLVFALNDALRFAEKHRSVRSSKVELKAPGEWMFMGHLLLIYQMTINLVLNAADATGYKGHIRLRLLEKNGFAVIEVHDNGPGVPESRRNALLEPFYTTKKDGSGLGLLSVQACAHAHQGEVVIGDSDLGGACFAVCLKKTPPVVDDEAAEAY
ncbi:MAG: HAMP domain-containing histidine kinase [Desulfobacterales bacterium]|nr:HAMP domain-containing histidine kinase [Desulfobacterales bacterium]MBS3754520.1 HAMP domain-containing histidine kinase [Desulfobacterales bacterium]